MPAPDPAAAVKDDLAARWADDHADWAVTLHVDDDYRPVAGSPVLLVADDGGTTVHGGAWLVRKDMLRIVIRLTALAAGRSEAREVLDAAVDDLVANRPAGIRIENVPAALETRDRETGAFLASITMPVIVRPL